jgi:hypothetical protein
MGAVSQFNPLTNLLLACLAAMGLVPALGLPWYATAVPMSQAEVDKGQIELTAENVARWFTSDGQTFTGTETLTGAKTALLVIAAVTIALCVLVLLPQMRSTARGLLRLVPLAAPAIVLVHLFHQPGSNAGTELRWGVFVTLAISVLMASAAYQGGELQDRKPARAPYVPPAPPSYH